MTSTLVSRLRSGCDANTAFLLCYEAAEVVESLHKDLAEAQALLRELKLQFMDGSDTNARIDAAIAGSGGRGDVSDLRNLKRRVERARKFPENTCAASRHVHLIADQLSRGTVPHMLIDEPQHCADSMLSVLEALWKARTELRKFRGRK